MDYKEELEKALDHIESLQKALDWVGGDLYEIDCIANMTEGISEFIEKHRPMPKNIDPREPDKRLGKYTLKVDSNRIVYAHNKREAKNLLKATLKQVKCIVPPLTRWQVYNLKKEQL